MSFFNFEHLPLKKSLPSPVWWSVAVIDMGEKALHSGHYFIKEPVSCTPSRFSIGYLPAGGEGGGGGGHHTLEHHNFLICFAQCKRCIKM